MIDLIERYGLPAVVVGGLWALESVLNIIDTVAGWF